MDETMSTDPLLQRLQGLSWPQALLDTPHPQRGDVWRAYWPATGDPVACTVVVTADAEGRGVEVAPVDSDPISDETGVTLTATNGMELTVWTGLRGRIYKCTLHQRLTTLDPDAQRHLAAVATGDTSAEWAPIVSDLDDRSLVRADLADRIQALADADWLPIVTTGHTLRELAAEANLDASFLAKHLSISPGDARRLLQGKRLPDARERELLTEVLGIRPDDNLVLDEDLVVELDEPEHRPGLHRRAVTEHGGDEVAARIDVAESLMATAFRHFEPGQTDWKTAIRDALGTG